MISKLTVSNDPLRFPSQERYLASIPSLQTPIEFKPGVNFLIGPNGSGKSSILKMLARATYCEQGGTQKKTREAIRKAGETPIQLEQDGGPVLYCSASINFGLIGGMAGFDDDFFHEGIQSIQRTHLSEGQAMLDRLLPMLDVLCGKKELPKFPVDTPSEGATVLLFDEPERSLSIDNTLLFFRRLSYFATKHKRQVIVATHSPFACMTPDVHIVEVGSGRYWEIMQRSIKELVKFQNTTDTSVR